MSFIESGCAHTPAIPLLCHTTVLEVQAELVAIWKDD